MEVGFQAGDVRFNTVESCVGVHRGPGPSVPVSVLVLVMLFLMYSGGLVNFLAERVCFCPAVKTAKNEDLTVNLTEILSHPAWTGATGALMVVVTVLLVVVTWQLTKTAKNQTAFIERQVVALEREQKHEIKMGLTGKSSADGKRHFEGFTLTNVGIPTVTIIGAHISPGIPVTDTQTVGVHLGLGWTKEIYGKTISDFQPPHRLQAGDRIEVLYDLDKLAAHIDPGQRIRYECQDSLGNAYVLGWIDYSGAPESMSIHDTPSEGFRAPAIP